MGRLGEEVRRRPLLSRLCRGSMLSRGQYIADVTERGYRDARHWPSGPMGPKAASHWTEAFLDEQADGTT